MEWRRVLVAELRYLGSWLAVVGALLLTAFLAITIGKAAHLSISAITAISFVFLGAFGFAALMFWLRNRNVNKAAAPPARYGPIVLPAAVFLLDAYLILSMIPDLQEEHWKNGVESFAILCLSTGVLVFYTVRDWLSRYRRGGIPAPIPAFTKKRLEQFAAAAELPTAAERRRAIRPLVRRGYVRLGLLVLDLVLFLVLAPAIGVLLAFLSSIVLFGGVFLILRWLVDL